ncbi:MAG: SUMF1/EgtB/PvdO family nonheme iron enzyme [Polyangiaceae bacterium]
MGSVAITPQRAAAQSSEDVGEEGDPAPSASASAAPSARPPLHPPPAHAQLPAKDGMIRLPGGAFTMGSNDLAAPPNEKPAHAVTVSPFWIDRTEVTVGAYRACVDKHACAIPAKTSRFCTFDAGDPDSPVSCVHWSDADAYCRFAAKRLPREIEWEFAARGNTPARFPWGGGVSTCVTAATLLREGTAKSCTGLRPAKVGAHPMGASQFGIVDLSGNVEEWTADWYAENAASGASPRAGASHVLRGGGWLSPPSMSKTTSRDWGSAMEAGPNVGFRCARDGARDSAQDSARDSAHGASL